MTLTPRTLRKLTLSEFESMFTLKPNPSRPSASDADATSSGEDFKTHGQELAFVQSQNPATVWTLIDEHAGWMSLQSGYHEEGAICHYISSESVPDDAAFYVWFDPDED